VIACKIAWILKRGRAITKKRGHARAGQKNKMFRERDGWCGDMQEENKRKGGVKYLCQA